MITNYRTQGTKEYSLLRLSFVRLSHSAAINGGKLGMILCADNAGNVQPLLQAWATRILDSIGLTLFVNGAAYDGDPVSEQKRCWSHGNRLRLGRFRT